MINDGTHVDWIPSVVMSKPGSDDFFCFVFVLFLFCFVLFCFERVYPMGGRNNSQVFNAVLRSESRANLRYHD